MELDESIDFVDSEAVNAVNFLRILPDKIQNTVRKL